MVEQRANPRAVTPPPEPAIQDRPEVPVAQAPQQVQDEAIQVPQIPVLQAQPDIDLQGLQAPIAPANGVAAAAPIIQRAVPQNTIGNGVLIQALIEELRLLREDREQERQTRDKEKRKKWYQWNYRGGRGGRGGGYGGKRGRRGGGGNGHRGILYF